MARIYSRDGKSGTVWYLDYALDGQRLRKRLGRSKKLAELALADVQVKLERRELGFAAKDRDLKGFIEEYLTYAKSNKAKKSYERDLLILRHFVGFIKVDRLGVITPTKLEAYKTHRLEQGIKTATLNRELNTIKAMLNKAVAWGALAKSPGETVKKFREPRKKIRFLSEAEVQSLKKAADERLLAIIETFLHTGLRRDELIHLTWADIDQKNNILSVQAKDSWHPKDYELRHIPMTDRLAKVFRSIGESDGYIFANNGGKPLNEDILTRDFRKLARSCGIKNATIHTLRHTFASHLVMNGVDLYTIQKLLGHSSIKTTEIYAHLTPDFLRSAVNKLPFQ